VVDAGTHPYLGRSAFGFDLLDDVVYLRHRQVRSPGQTHDDRFGVRQDLALLKHGMGDQFFHYRVLSIRALRFGHSERTFKMPILQQAAQFFEWNLD
jgi:hypothetical protein